MSLSFITTRERVTSTTFSHVYDYADTPGAGFAFDCDAQGNLESLNGTAAASLLRCQEGLLDGSIVDRGVVTYRHTYTEPASVRCDCSTQVWLEDSLYNQCPKCGLGINGCGQRLAPIRQWSDEERYATFGPRNDHADDY